MTPPADLRLTDAQQRAVDADAPAVRITGGAGTGKTTTLLARYRRLVATVPASSILVVCPNRQAANRFRDAVLPDLSGGFDTLPITTIHGVAFDLVTRGGAPVDALGGADQRELVVSMLATEGPAEWPTLHPFLRRRQFVREVADAVLDLQRALVTEPGEGPWAELAAFASRYREALAGAGRTDYAGVLAQAVARLDRPEFATAETARFVHVLVDDYQAATPVADALISRLAGLGAGVTVAGDPKGLHHGPAAGGVEDPCFLTTFATRFGAVDVELLTSFRNPEPPTLVRCAHPSVEPEAVAGILLDAHDGGVAWDDMAVLVRRRGERARAIARALARHDIPVAAVSGPSADEPTVAAIVDMLRWVNGDAAAFDRLVASPVAGLDPADVRVIRKEAATDGIALEQHPRLEPLAALRADLAARADTDSPAALAFEVWQRTLGHLVDDAGGASAGRALDAVVAFCDALERRAGRLPGERLAGFLVATGGEVAPDRWRPAAAAATEVVTVTSITAAAGREWHTVVVAGCVEGELPKVRMRHGPFDREVLAGRATAADTTGTRPTSLHHERALFAAACSRATRRLVGTAAPEPGVLLSRFVESWPLVEPQLSLAPGPDMVARAATTGVTPISPDGALRLSASRLATYDDCPLRYAYEYVLGARDEAGVRADLGSLVHEVLAAFLDPDEASGVAHTLDGLLDLGEQRWRDDIAPYRPQVEEARRDFFTMLRGWWETEGNQGDLAPEVVAVERRFEIDVGPHRLAGAIDRIDRTATGTRIVDYKTGKSEPKPDQMADDLQLAVYHLAAVRDPELSALGTPTELRLLYLRTMHVYAQEIGPDHERRTEERVLERAAHIQQERFEPSVDATCRTCSFQRLCPLHPEGRQTA